jgi:hypothetical protein
MARELGPRRPAAPIRAPASQTVERRLSARIQVGVACRRGIRESRRFWSFFFFSSSRVVTSPLTP